MSRRLLEVLAAFAAASWLSFGSALADNATAPAAPPVSAAGNHRIALVIGNSTYQSVGKLKNPANDANSVADILNSAGFEVIRAVDLSRDEMRQVIGTFTAKVTEAGADTTALVFYAGHGVQVDGENYLVPIDAKLAQASELPDQTVRLVDLMKALQAVPSKMRIVMLDACRNNPFAGIGNVAGKGLAIVDAPSGSIVAYSTAPGTEALDGRGLHSPYAAAFMKEVKEPGVPIEQLFKHVRVLVNEATDGKQIPWESSSLTTDFTFFTPAATQVASTQTDAGVSVQPVKLDPAARVAEIRTHTPYDAYEIAVEEDTVEIYEEYIRVYADDPLCNRIRRLLERRRQMLAWYQAVRSNSPESYDIYLRRFPRSDLAQTALRLRSHPRIVLASLDFRRFAHGGNIRLPADRVVTLSLRGPKGGINASGASKLANVGLPHTGPAIGGTKLPTNRVNLPTNVPARVGKANIPTNRIVTQPTNIRQNNGVAKLPTNRVANLPTNVQTNVVKPTVPVNRIVTQPTNRIVTQPTNRIVTQPTNRIVTQPTNRVVTQPNNRIVILQPTTGAPRQSPVATPQFNQQQRFVNPTGASQLQRSNENQRIQLENARRLEQIQRIRRVNNVQRFNPNVRRQVVSQRRFSARSSGRSRRR